MSIILMEDIHSVHQILKGLFEPKWLKPLLTTHVKFSGSDNPGVSQNYLQHREQLNCELLIPYDMIYVYLFVCVDLAWLSSDLSTEKPFRLWKIYSI